MKTVIEKACDQVLAWLTPGEPHARDVISKPTTSATDVRILFILKYRENDALWLTDDEQQYSQGHLSSGLANSASFVDQYLRKNGIDSKLVHVVDNNCIDREVTLYKPTHVIIEAFWVVPEKFEVLTKLHPKVKWIIRDHSHTPFLATEGIAFGWAMDYLQYDNVYLSCNHPGALHDMRLLARASNPMWSESQVVDRVRYLPNVYVADTTLSASSRGHRGTLRVSCFGAVRPLKNHVIQAMAAIEYARRHRLELEFHINGTRKEGNGEPVLKNLRSIFDSVKHAKLVEHSWMEHDDFLGVLASMDVNLQVSYTETFNIVTADAVTVGVPVVVSKEIDWVSSSCYADPNDSESILNAIELVLKNPMRRDMLIYQNKVLLDAETTKNGKYWLTWF